MTDLVIPEGTAKVSRELFAGCTSLRSANIPGSMAKTSENLFAGCTNLRSVHISEGVTEIWFGIFFGCSALSDVYYGGTAEEWEKPPINAEGTAYDGNYWHYAPDGVTPVVWELQPDVAAASEGTDAADGERRADFDRFD